MATVNAQRIAGNTITMYIRTIVTMLITLYSSRIILKNLGVEDFGIYNLVGGVVTLLTVFTTSLSRVSIRFISYEIGKLGFKDVQSVFSLCFFIHLTIAIIVVLLGLLLKGIIIPSLNIPTERIVTAELVFVFSVITFALSVLRIPFDSLLISYERMNIYALLGIMDSVLKLVAAILIGYVITDRLLAYSWLITIMGGSLLVLTVILCFIRIGYYHLNHIGDLSLLRKYFAFIGWSMLGGSMEVITVNAFVIAVNIFYGVVVNAAIGIMNQVYSAVSRFLSSFSMSYTPQIIKTYAEHDMRMLSKLICSSSKMSFILISAISWPLIINMDSVLNIWLTDVPPYTTSFCRVILVCTMVDALTSVYNTSITASGKIKGYNCLLSLSYIVNLAFTILIAYYRYSPTYVIACRLLTLGILNMTIGWYVMNKEFRFNLRHYSEEVLRGVGILLVIGILTSLYLVACVEWRMRLLISVFPFEVTYLWVVYRYVLKENEKQLISKLLNKMLIRMKS